MADGLPGEVIHNPVSADRAGNAPSSLGRLLTDLGERSLYDAASQCSRCGYCEQSCPTYKATGDEKKSPRGRNQLVRLLLEGKAVDKAAAAEALDTCLLCSACTAACYAHVPTADIVLEGRRLLRDETPWLARTLSRLLLEKPRAFERLLKLAYLAKRLGFSRLARPLLRWAGLPGVAIADSHVGRAPKAFSHELLRGAGGAYRQFQPCGTRYLFTEVAVATEKALSKRGGSKPLVAGCCGLLAYNYGDVSDARRFAQSVIEASAASAAETPIVVDCSSCAAFLKSYEQLFLDDEDWRARAKAFAARIKDAVEVFSDVKPPAGTVRYHESCRACHGQGLPPPAAFAPLDAARDCCGGAGAYAFLQPETSEALARKKLELAARERADAIVTSSTSCLIQLAHAAGKYYPSTAVRHISEIAAFSDDEASG